MILKKNSFKLMDTSVYDETMKIFRNRLGVRLATNSIEYQKLVSKPSFVSQNIFNKNLVSVNKIKEVLTLKKLAYVGMCILDLSKTLMYNFN